MGEVSSCRGRGGEHGPSAAQVVCETSVLGLRWDLIRCLILSETYSFPLGPHTHSN